MALQDCSITCSLTHCVRLAYLFRTAPEKVAATVAARTQTTANATTGLKAAPCSARLAPMST
jgi:hypothetical protein